jgi:formate hydrogenlyase transcriptional activator
MAQAIHKGSSRRNGPFVKLNCAAIPAGLLESELFGHDRGAFTGAVSARLGRFQLADKGTLFLDEIGELPLELQPKLLRVLQDQMVEKLGSNRTIRIDVRIAVHGCEAFNRYGQSTGRVQSVVSRHADHPKSKRRIE